MQVINHQCGRRASRCRVVAAAFVGVFLFLADHAEAAWKSDSESDLTKTQSAENACSFCDVLATIWMQPDVKSAKDGRKQLAVDRFCKELPKPLDAECAQYVEQRGFGILKLLDGGWTTEQVCTRFGRCAGGYRRDAASLQRGPPSKNGESVDHKGHVDEEDKPPALELNRPELPRVADQLAKTHKQMTNSVPNARVAGLPARDGPPALGGSGKQDDVGSDDYRQEEGGELDDDDAEEMEQRRVTATDVSAGSVTRGGFGMQRRNGEAYLDESEDGSDDGRTSVSPRIEHAKGETTDEGAVDGDSTVVDEDGGIDESVEALLLELDAGVTNLGAEIHHMNGAANWMWGITWHVAWSWWRWGQTLLIQLPSENAPVSGMNGTTVSQPLSLEGDAATGGIFSLPPPQLLQSGKFPEPQQDMPEGAARLMHALIYDPQALTDDHANRDLVWAITSTLQRRAEGRRGHEGKNGGALLVQLDGEQGGEGEPKRLTSEEARDGETLVTHLKQISGFPQLDEQSLPQLAVGSKAGSAVRHALHLAWWTKIFLAWSKRQITGEGLT